MEPFTVLFTKNFTHTRSIKKNSILHSMQYVCVLIMQMLFSTMLSTNERTCGAYRARLHRNSSTSEEFLLLSIRPMLDL